MKSILLFIKKWFFPSTFGLMFYVCFIALWFGIVNDKTWSNFLNYTVMMIVVFFPVYLAFDTNDGRFTKFIEHIESQGKWFRRGFATLFILLWFVCIAYTHKYFPIIGN